MNIKWITITNHRMPKYIGKHKTTAPSYFRIWLGGKYLIDIPAPRYNEAKRKLS